MMWVPHQVNLLVTTSSTIYFKTIDMWKTKHQPMVQPIQTTKKKNPIQSNFLLSPTQPGQLTKTHRKPNTLNLFEHNPFADLG